MKIRRGFVSNSSSSSFCIYGVELAKDEAQTLMSNYVATRANCSACTQRYRCKTDELDMLDLPCLNDILITQPPEEGVIYFGREWCEIKDDETGFAFKKATEKRLRQILGEGISIYTINKGWENY